MPPDALDDAASSEAARLARLPADAYAESLTSVRGATLAKMRAVLDREQEKLEALRRNA